MGGLVTILLDFIVLSTILCNTSAVVDVAAIVSAAAQVVSAGSSLAGVTISSLMESSYSVNCGMEIENWTKFPLVSPAVTIQSGVLTTPPGDILPCKIEAVVARKTANSAKGTSGTVSWLVEGKDRRIVLMWEAPYDFNLYNNWIGVGITSPGITHHAKGDNWFNQMYYEKNSTELGFNRGQYYYGASPTIYKDDVIEISGIMSTNHHAVVKITVRPVNDMDLAPPIRAVLGL